MHGSAGDSNFMECRLGDIFGDGGWEQHVPVFLNPGAGATGHAWTDKHQRFEPPTFTGADDYTGEAGTVVSVCRRRLRGVSPDY
jgi:hypothetical protein